MTGESMVGCWASKEKHIYSESRHELIRSSCALSPLALWGPSTWFPKLFACEAPLLAAAAAAEDPLLERPASPVPNAHLGAHEYAFPVLWSLLVHGAELPLYMHTLTTLCDRPVIAFYLQSPLGLLYSSSECWVWGGGGLLDWGSWVGLSCKWFYSSRKYSTSDRPLKWRPSFSEYKCSQGWCWRQPATFGYVRAGQWPLATDRCVVWAAETLSEWTQTVVAASPELQEAVDRWRCGRKRPSFHEEPVNTTPAASRHNPLFTEWEYFCCPVARFNSGRYTQCIRCCLSFRASGRQLQICPGSAGPPQELELSEPRCV